MRHRRRSPPGRRLRRASLLAAAVAVAVGTAGAQAPDAGTGEASEPPAAATTDPADRRVLRVRLDGVVMGAVASFFERAVRAAEEGGYQAVLVTIDTPGGALDATRDIVQVFMEARIPVITYVTPSAAQAASAGTFITMAGHIAAMAPGTNIGAAHPVTIGGKDPEAEGSEHMGRKVENDVAAFARSVAEQRGRNVEWAEKAVRESVSVTATEALELKIVDLLAPTEAALLEAVDGRSITLPDREVVLRTRGARISEHQMTISERTMSVLGNPNVLYILGALAVLGIMIEFYNPGMIIPGAVGAFFLLLVAIGFNILPVSLGAVVLLVVAAAMLIAEMYVPSFGLLTLGGAVCLVLGSLLLMDHNDPEFYVDPSVRISWGLIVPTVLGIGLVSVLLGWALVRARKAPYETGAEGMVGEAGRAQTDVGPDGGWVFVHGERWQARSAEPIESGAAVKVVRVEGLRLEVVRNDAA